MDKEENGFEKQGNRNDLKSVEQPRISTALFGTEKEKQGREMPSNAAIRRSTDSPGIEEKRKSKARIRLDGQRKGKARKSVDTRRIRVVKRDTETEENGEPMIRHGTASIAEQRNGTATERLA